MWNIPEKRRQCHKKDKTERKIEEKMRIWAVVSPAFSQKINIDQS